MGKKKGLNMEVSIGGVSEKDVLLFTKHLYVVLKNGLTIVDGLDILHEQSKGKIKSIISKIRKSVVEGDSVSAALKKYPKTFPSLYINMIKKGEESGTLEDELKRLAHELEKSIKLKSKIKSALIYPAFVLIAVFGLGMSVAIFILPKILPLFRTLNVDLPVTTKILIWVAEVFKDHGNIIFISSVVGGIFLFWLLKRKFMRPLTHRALVKTPVVGGIVKNIELQRFTRTFGTLLESGLTVDRSLEITIHSTVNVVYKGAIKKTLNRILSGETLVESMKKYPKLFPPIAYRMVGVGEETGSLEETLNYLALFYEEEVDNTTKNLSTVIEPLLLITIGSMVGLVAMAILSPIYEITGNLN